MSDYRVTGKLDDVTWHTDGDYPEWLPSENAATHTGMFLAWIILNGLLSEVRRQESETAVQAVVERRMTGAQFLLSECDGKLLFEDLLPEAQLFAEAYLQGEYLADYSLVFDDVESVYGVPDTWSNFERIAPAINRRHAEWRESGAFG